MQPTPPPPPPGYAQYGAPAAPQKTNGLSIASMVLGIVGAIPCFWGLNIFAVLALIFGFVSKGQIAKSNGAQKGKGMAIAGLVLGIIFTLLLVGFWVYIATSDNCTFSGGKLECVS